MKVRLIFDSPHCGSKLIRPSWKRSFRDPFLRIFGVRPQRCRVCRSRFYLFNPSALRAFVAALNRPAIVAEDVGVEGALLPAEGKRRRWMGYAEWL